MSIPKTRTLALFVGLACVATAGGLMLAAEALDTSPAPLAANHDTTMPAVTIAAPRWPAREGGVWAFEVRSAFQLGAGGEGALADTGVVHRIRGRIHARLARRTVGGDLVAARLSDVDVSAGEVVDHRVARALQVPFVLRYSDDGRLLGVDVAAEIASTDVATRIRGLFAALQCAVVDPEARTDGGRAWRSTETDPNGTYEASYAVAGNRAIERTARRYAHGSARDGQSVEVVETSARFTLGAVWFERAETHDRLRVLERGEVFGGVVQDTELARIPGLDADLQLDEGLDAHLRRTAADAVDAALADDDRPEPRAATAADRQRFAELVAALAESAGRDVQSLRALRALLREVPELAAAMPRAIRGAEDDRARAVLVHALESADVPSCHDALAAIAGDVEQTPLDRLRAVAGLGAASDPGDEVLDAVWSWAAGPRAPGVDQRFSDTALLAFGRLCERAEGPGAERLLGRLEDSVRHAPDDGRGVVALRAVGNAARPRLFDAAADRLAAPTAQVRAAAADALARCDAERAVTPLTDLLARESDPIARYASAKALATLPASEPSTRAVVERRLLGETDPRARREMARWLVDRVEDAPASFDLLARLMETERDPATRRMVGAALARRPR